MKKPNRITVTWFALLFLTLASAMIAEAGDPPVFAVLFVVVIVAVKGNLVIDQLMGLRTAPRLFRVITRSYFYVVPSFIAVAMLVPGFTS